MDRALKERIIGATVLVLFVVLIVPVFLDGPEDDNEVITQTVPLPGQEGVENQTIVLHRDREQPVPAANSNKPATDNAATPAKPDPEPEANESRQEEPEQEAPAVTETRVDEPEVTEQVASAEVPVEITSSTGMWAVQLGSFGNQDNANKLAADLRRQNFTAFLSKLSTGNEELHRVRIGPQKDRESAEKVAEQLAKAGHKGQVVPHP